MQACVPNIGPNQRRRRLIAGMVALAAATGYGAWVLSRGEPHVLLAVAIFLPLHAALLGFLQYRERT